MKSNKQILKEVQEYPRKYKEGYIGEEVLDILKKYENYINKDMFYDALMGITGIMIDEKFITYPVDIEKAVICGLENRKLKGYEWD